MRYNINVLKLKDLAQNILTCDDDFLIMKQSVDLMYSIFLEISDISIQNFNIEQILLPTSKAISPSYAAHCLLEMRRTSIFLRGIYKAILFKKREKQYSKNKILYAGTGPYATLITPLLTLFEPQDIFVDLLDINPISLKSAEKVIISLEMQPFIGSNFLADASVFKIEKSYDIVISETMQAALKNEPQVAIMQNLIPQMNNDAIFIPEAITISASLVSNGLWDGISGINTGVVSNFLGNLMTIDKHHYKTEGYKMDFKFSDKITHRKFMLYTDIRVFENEILKDGDCSLTLPLKVCEVEENQKGSILFWYEKSQVPGFRCVVEGTETIIEAIEMKSSSILTDSTISTMNSVT